MARPARSVETKSHLRRRSPPSRCNESRPLPTAADQHPGVLAVHVAAGQCWGGVGPAPLADRRSVVV